MDLPRECYSNVIDFAAYRTRPGSTRRYRCVGEFIPGYESPWHPPVTVSYVYADSRFKALELARRQMGERYRVRAWLVESEQVEDGA